MKHYYTNNEDLISELEQFIFTYRGKELIFTSDHGVFSKKMIDFGSRVLLDAIELDEGKSTLLDVGAVTALLGLLLKVLTRLWKSI